MYRRMSQGSALVSDNMRTVGSIGLGHSSAPDGENKRARGQVGGQVVARVRLLGFRGRARQRT